LDKTTVRIFRVVAVLKTDGALSSEILVIFSQTTRRHIPQQNIFIVTNMRNSTFSKSLCLSISLQGVISHNIIFSYLPTWEIQLSPKRLCLSISLQGVISHNRIFS
jgi:c-di-AMP phosphodiesterase-like protein